MDPISLTFAAIGLGTTIAGMFGKNKADKEAARIAAQKAALQRQIAGEQIKSVDLQQKVADIQLKKTRADVETQKKVIGIQQRGEDARQAATHADADLRLRTAKTEAELASQAASLDASRRQREIVRSSIAARSAAMATGVAQGAGTGDSSIRASQQQAGSRGDVSRTGVSQNLDLQRRGITENLALTTEGIDKSLKFSDEMFGFNREITNTALAAQDRSLGFLEEGADLERQQRDIQKTVFTLGGDINVLDAGMAKIGGDMNFWGGIGMLGTTLMNQAGTFGKIGTFLGTKVIQ